MNSKIKELGQVGNALADELEGYAKKYHIKSDKHEILSWEAVGVRGMADQLIKGQECTYEILESTLLSDWGNCLASELPELFGKVAFFRKEYTKVKNT